MKITKEITFDSAHMLSNYSGKCSNLHGHTYKVQVTLEGEVNQKVGMIVDFNELKNVLNETIMKLFDHAIIFSGPEIRDESENELLKWAVEHHKKHFILVSGKTTCENLCSIICNIVQDYLSFGQNDLKVFVKLWETPTSFAEC